MKNKHIHTIVIFLTIFTVIVWSVGSATAPVQAAPLLQDELGYMGDIGSASIKDSTNANLVVTTTAAAAAGDSIVIAYGTDPSQDLTVSVTDSVGNKYQQAAMAISVGNMRTFIFAAYNVTALPIGGTITINQVVVSSTAVAARAAVVSVFRGLAPVGALEQTSVSSQTAGTTPSSGAATTIQPDQLLIGAVGTEGPAGDTAGTWLNSFTAGPRAGTTATATDAEITISMGWQIVSAAGSYTAAKSGITSRDLATAIATFKTTTAGISFIGNVGSAQTKASAGTSLAVTTNAAVAAGDDILVTFAMDGNADAVSVTDSAANTYTQVVNSQFTTPGVTNVRTVVFAAFNVTALPSGGTITITHPSVTARSAVVSVFRGLANSTVVDQTQTANGTAAAVSSGATGTTTQAAELLIGAVGLEGPNYDAPSVWQNSFTFGPRLGTNFGTGTGGGDGDVTVQMGWRIVGATGAYNAQIINLNTARDWAAAIVTLKADLTVTNQAPVVTDIPDQTIAEGASFATINLDDFVSDVDNTDAEMIWSYTGNTNLTVSITNRVATISTPNADWSGAETITFRATDLGDLFDEDAATFTVTPVNDAPVVTDIPNQTIAEGASFATINLDDFVSDVDNTDAEMTWSYTGNTNLTVSITNRVATISTPNADWSGAETITFRATDLGDLFDEDAATFTVTPVNDAPVAVDDGATIPMNTDLVIAASTLKANDTDVDNTNAELSVTAVSNPTNGTVILASGTITFTPTTGFTGTAGFDYTVSDGFLTDTGHVTITVTSVNVAPVITEGASINVTMSANGAFIPFNLVLNATDVNGDTLTWSILTQAVHGTAAASGTGGSMVINYTPAADYVGLDSFVVQVADGNGGTDTITVNVTIKGYIFLPLIWK